VKRTTVVLAQLLVALALSRAASHAVCCALERNKMQTGILGFAVCKSMRVFVAVLQKTQRCYAVCVKYSHKSIEVSSVLISWIVY
jgi:hypothetical protein